MRENSGIMETTPDIKADIYRLESILESSLKSYDQNIGTEIFEWLKVHHIPKTEYIFLLIADLTYKNLQAKDGKPRFKHLRKAIERLLPKNPNHKSFKKFAESEAKRLKCHVGDMDLDLDFEGTGFRW